MHEALRLLAYHLCDLGMGVSQVRHPDSAQEIKITPPLRIIQIGTLSAHHGRGVPVIGWEEDLPRNLSYLFESTHLFSLTTSVPTPPLVKTSSKTA